MTASPCTPAALLDEISVIIKASEHDGSATPDMAITAIGHLGRAMHQLAMAHRDAERERDRCRRLLLGEVATGCHGLTRQWAPADGRLCDLAGIASDLLARRVPDLDSDERWAVGTRLNTAVAEYAAFATRGPYRCVPALRRVQRSSALVSQHANLDPPDPAALHVIDAPVPTREVTPEPAEDVSRSTVRLLNELDRARDARQLNMASALCTALAAEQVARHGVLVAELLPGPTTGMWQRAGHAWTALAAAIARFDDGSRYERNGEASFPIAADRLRRAITRLPAISLGDSEADDGHLTAMRTAVNQLPAFARHLEAALVTGARTHRIFARARSLPPSEAHLDDVLRNRFVMASTYDIRPAVAAARVTRRISVDLALELNRSSDLVGTQPQPNLLAALHREERRGPLYEVGGHAPLAAFGRGR